MQSTNWDKMYSSVYYLSVILTVICATEEDSFSINKPLLRSAKPWHFSIDYVRCFCNLPSCVTTGYMCKSSGGGCFSDLMDQPSIPRSAAYRGRHGCLELLSEKEQKTRCDTKRGINERTTLRRKENPRSLLLCCHHDMCNHIESPQTKNLMNNTFLGDVPEESDSRYQQQQQEPFLYSNSEVWFRAATIAVPICGAVILFVLIALAVKILKNEHQNSTLHKLGPAMYVHAVPQQCKGSGEKYHPEHLDRTYDNLLGKEYLPTHHQNTFYPALKEDFHQHQIQIPLLVQNDLISSGGESKNETNAKLNLMSNREAEPGKSIILNIEKDGTASRSNVNLDINVNSGSKYSSDLDKFCTGKPFIS